MKYQGFLTMPYSNFTLHTRHSAGYCNGITQKCNCFNMIVFTYLLRMSQKAIYIISVVGCIIMLAGVFYVLIFTL